MKNIHSFRKFVPCLLLIALAMMVGAKRSEAYPAAGVCDSTGCHFDIRNNNDYGNGSLRLAIDQGCKTPGNHLIEFQRFPAAVTVIQIKSQLSLLNTCQGTFEFAGGPTTGDHPKEVIIDGSNLPRNQSNNNPDGKNCALFLGTGNHNIHHLTFVGAPNAVCVYGDNVKVTDNNFGVKRDGTVQGNVNGLFINQNKAQVLNNAFAGNDGDGLILQGHQNLIQHNYFGVASGDINTDKGNGGAGIRLIDASSQNDIGYAVSGDNACQGDCSPTSSNPQSNIIRFNKKGGVILSGTPESTRNVISGNMISANVGLGIDLNNDGPSLPVPGATGPNNMMPIATQVQTFPLETNNPTNWYIAFKAPLHAYYEIYKIGDSDAADTNQLDGAGKSYGEGHSLLARGQANSMSTDGLTGVPLANPILQIHNKVSILLRDEQGNTSEFSANIEVSDQPVPPPSSGCGKDAQCNPATDGACCGADCKWIPDGNDCRGTPGTCVTNTDNTHTCKPPSGSCGDGHVDMGEQCDDGNDPMTGNGTPNSCCKSNCTLQGSTQDCTVGGQPGKCDGMTDTCKPLCGNHTLDPGEACDDGADNGHPENGSCCKSDCSLQGQGTGCTVMSNPGTCAGTTDTCNVCGDGTVQPGEDCEPSISGDCCSTTCTWIPQGNTCRSMIGVCGPGPSHDCCGDGVVGVGEACDDGGNTAGDGCDATCNVEPGWTCTGSPSVCNHTCGNGVVDAGEDCDPMTSGTCCDSACHWITPGSACSSGPGVCDSVHTCCGDGTVDPGEGCDDGNNANGDGCSSVCATEPGYTCTGSPSHCTPGGGTCGDSIVQGTEQCDGGACCNPGCTIKTDGTVCNDSGGTCLAGVCTNTNPGGGVVPPGFSGPMSIEGSGFCSLNMAAGDSNALVMVVLDFIGAVSLGLFRFRKSRKNK